MKKLDNQLKKLEKAKNLFFSEIGNMESILSDLIDLLNDYVSITNTAKMQGLNGIIQELNKRIV